MTSPAAIENDPFNRSLWGEYARLLLIGTAVFSAAVWSLRLAVEPIAIAMVVANVVVVGISVGNRFAGLSRLTVTSLLVIGIVAICVVTQNWNTWSSPSFMFSPMVTIGALLVLVLRDLFIVIGTRAGEMSTGKIVIVAAILCATAYLVVVPSVDAFLQTFQEQPKSYRIEELSPLEVIRIRSSKLVIFGIFAYAGACVGSFLNVVAQSVPRGQPIALRTSACPQCAKPIRRIDNLPIVSYLLLRGRCRNCEAEIPARYLFVELAGLAIFASLFLFELITGAANVPGFQEYYYAGILWIILYTKWPVVGIYFFHCALFSCLLVLALMEQDRLRLPKWMNWALPAVFAGLVIAVPTLLPVPLVNQLPFRLSMALPAWLDGLIKCTVGGVVGAGLATLAKLAGRRLDQQPSLLVLGFALVGVCLGWQAVATIAIGWLAAVALVVVIGKRRRFPSWLRPTTILLIVAMLHHPVWKLSAESLSLGSL